MVDTSPIEVTHHRTIGAEYVCHSMRQEISFYDFLKNYYTRNEITHVESLVAGRLIEQSSELHSKNWIEKCYLFEYMKAEANKNGVVKAYEKELSCLVANLY